MKLGIVLRLVALAVVFILMAFTAAGIVWLESYSADTTRPPVVEIPKSISTVQAVTTSTIPYRVSVKEIYTHPISNPVRIVIPDIGVDAPIVQVGFKTEGVIQTPTFGNAAWFKLGPPPGDNGPSVIIGHVSSLKKGKDVFFRLGELQEGAVFTIYGKSGDSAKFVVDSAEMALKTELPTKKIWPSTYLPLLTLITCGGEYDKDSKHFLSNVIVYCHLVEEKP